MVLEPPMSDAIEKKNRRVHCKVSCLEKGEDRA